MMCKYPYPHYAFRRGDNFPNQKMIEEKKEGHSMATSTRW
jgi:hypothetical protein